MEQAKVPLIPQQIPQFKQARISTLRQNYQPADYPPDLTFAQEHACSQRVGAYIGPLEDVMRCRCCLEPIHKSQLSLNCNLSQLFHLGTSTPLYFQFIKNCMALLIFNLFLLALPAYIINYSQGNQCGIVNGGVKGLLNSICRGSAINIMNIRKIDTMQIQSGLFFAGVLANIIFIALLQLRMDQLVSLYGQGRLKAVDYSLMIKGLPTDITLSQIQTHIEQKMTAVQAPDHTINKIYIIYNFKNYLDMLQKKQELAQSNINLYYQIQQLDEKNLKSSDYQRKLQLQERKTDKQDTIKRNIMEKEKWESQIHCFQESTKKIQMRIKSGGALESQDTRGVSNFSGKVIITLNHRHSQQLLLDKYGQSDFCERVSYSLSQLLETDRNKIIIAQAPQPEDIIFANMGSNATLIWKTRLIYSLLIFLLLALDFLIIALAKKLIKQQKAIQNGNIIFSFINSIIVSLFGSLFRQIIRRSQGDSYYNTYSKLGYQIVSKMVLVFMINMLFTTFAANVASFYLLKQDQPTFDAFPLNFQTFLYDCFFLIATNPFFSLFMAIFDHRHIRQIIKKYRIQHNHLPVSQGQANSSYEHMNFDACHKYGTIYRFFLFSGGIAILYPMGIFLCMIGLTAIYWLDKYLLVKRYSVTLKMTARFTVMVQRLMAQFPIYLSLTTLLVMFIPIQDGMAFQGGQYTKVYYYLSGIALFLSITSYWIGSSWLKHILRRLLSIKQRQKEQQFPQYKHIENNLVSDYSHNYPYFRVNNQSTNEDSPSKLDKMSEMSQSEQLGTLDNIKHYMSQNRYDQE